MTPSDRDRPDRDRPDENDSAADDRLDEPLEDRLAELTDVLAELRSDLESERRTSGVRSGDGSRIPGPGRRPPFRPPNPVELLRLTERYTIPALIALLETTIRSLELLQASLRLADPDGELRSDADRSMPGRRGSDRSRTGGDRLADVRDGAAAGLTRSLSELRRALSESDLPREATSREILEDARELTAEIEGLLADAENRDRAGKPDRAGRRRPSGDRDDRDDRDDEVSGDSAAGAGRDVRSEPVSIDVTEPTQEVGADGEPDDVDTDSGTTDDGTDAPEVDVDAELESIKRRIETDDESETNEEDGDDGEEQNGEDDEKRSDEKRGDADDEPTA
ncbi:DUF7547 family protein [Halopenitus persicus]|uniref:DUF7547 family protein n=1 Tax=Halopenitus persicus TaxID=1048396 RepID=UPI000BBAD8F9|nr:hypothetical protein [Halopenitus persicus]